MVIITMNAKIMIAIIATFAMLFAGVAVASESADAVTPEDAEVEKPFSVSYIVGDKTYISTYETGTITLSTIENLGASVPAHQTFAGWEETESGTTYAAGSTFIISEGNTAEVKATFNPTTYTATFKAFDGSVLSTVSGTFDDKKDLAAFAETLSVDREGYIFAGWLADGAESLVLTENLGELEGNVTYTATYTVDYKVTFIDGDKKYDSVEKDGQKVAMSISNMAIPDVGVREGFTFLGWFIGTEQVSDPAEYVKTITGDITFTAKWEPINCYVTFMAGDEVVKKVPVLYGETVGELTVPEGYTGWDFDFTQVIKKDTPVYAIPAAPAEPTGLANPTVQIMAIVIGVLAVFVVAMLVWKKDEVKVIIVKKLDKTKNQEEPKQ